VPATPHPICKQGALVLGYGPPDVQKELLVWGIAHRALQKLHLASPLSEFVDAKELMHLVTRQAIRGGDEHSLEGRQGGPIPEPIQPGAVEFGPTVPVIMGDMVLGQMPVGLRRYRRAEAVDLLGNGLGLLLTGRRDTSIQCDFPMVPPEGVQRQANHLCRGPSPIAEGTGMHHPTVAHRHSVH
jgi:hypothetical protein